MGEKLIQEVTGDIGTITINRPEKLNAISTDVDSAIYSSVKRFEDEGVRAGIIRSAGDRAFVAGADLTEIHGKSAAEFRQCQLNTRRTNDAIANSSVVFIAAVDGLAYGGGFEIALAADMIVAEVGVTFGLPETKLGLIPGGGGTQRLPRIVGSNIAKELLLTGDPIDAERAHDLGLVNILVGEGMAYNAARELAGTVCNRAPLAVSSAKEAVNQGLNSSLDTALSFEQEITFTLYGTADTQEGIEAFVEKRDPEFSGN